MEVYNCEYCPHFDKCEEKEKDKIEKCKLKKEIVKAEIFAEMMEKKC